MKRSMSIPQVLIVDDDKDYNDLLSIYLQNENFQVTSAYSAEEARSHFSQPFDCLIVDYLLGDCNGVELTEEFRKHQFCPAILISSHWEKQVTLRHLRHFFAVLPKPVNPKEFVFQVHSAVYVHRNWGKDRFLSDFVFHHTLEGILLLSTGGRVRSVNETAVQLLGYSAEELTHLEVTQLFEPEEVGRRILQLAQLGEFFAKEVQLRKKNGTLLPAYLTMHPIRFQKRIEAFSLYFVDISELKETQRQFSRSTSRLVAITKLQQHWFKKILHLHFLVVDENLRILSGDQEIFELFRPEEYKLFCPLTAEELLPEFLLLRLKRCLLGEYQVWEGELEGHTEWFRIVFSPILDEKEVMGAICVIENATVQKADFETKLQASRRNILGSLTQGLAHEFNNIFTTIYGSSELLLQMDLPPEGKKHAERILEVVQRGVKLIQRLSEMVEMESYYTKIVDLNQLAQEHIQEWRQKLEKEGISIACRPSPEPLIWKGDPHLFHKLLHILVENAYHAVLSTERKEIILALQREKDHALLKLSDTGQGIPPHHLLHIFDPFFTTKGPLGGGKIPGAGLGLAIAEGIIQKYGGRVEIESQLREGTTILLRLPLASEEMKV